MDGQAVLWGGEKDLWKMIEEGIKKIWGTMAWDSFFKANSASVKYLKLYRNCILVLSSKDA